MHGFSHGTCLVVLALLSAHGLLAQDLAEPDELQDPGGVLYLNAGETIEFEDLAGRVWLPDEPYLAPTQGATNTYRNDVDIDLTLVEEDEIPREVFIIERWCDCDFQYQLLVPNATYQVTLYFAEIWESCVPAALGGTNSDANASRLFNVEIEGQLFAEDFSQADAAEEDPDDGIGAIYKAVRLDFEVTVEDDVLDILLDDLGGGNPPENAAVKGLRILHKEEEEEEAILRPGDVNGDGGFNIADMVAQLNFLFGGIPLPECYVIPGSDPAQVNATGLAILDYNGDGSGNIADAVAGLSGLFGGGGPHVLGEDCVELEGSCDSNCVR